MHILTAPSTDSSVVSGTGSIVTFPGIVHDDDDASAPASDEKIWQNGTYDLAFVFDRADRVFHRRNT